MSLVVASRQTRPKGRVLANQRELASHVVPLPLVSLDDLHAGVWSHLYFNALRNWHSQMVESGGQNLVIDYLDPTRDLLRKASSGGCNPNALQLSNDVSLASPTSTTDARRSNVT